MRKKLSHAIGVSYCDRTGVSDCLQGREIGGAKGGGHERCDGVPVKKLHIILWQKTKEEHAFGETRFTCLLYELSMPLLPVVVSGRSGKY